MFLMLPMLLKCISLCRLPCCGWMLPKLTMVFICTKTLLVVHRLLGPSVPSYAKCRTLRSRVFDRDAEVWACNTISGRWLVEIKLVSPNSGNGIQLQPVHIYLGPMSLVLCGWLSLGFDRQISHMSYSKVSCLSANCCLDRTPWAQADEGAERQRNSTPGRGWELWENSPWCG